jgi:hypothetical protein
MGPYLMLILKESNYLTSESRTHNPEPFLSFTSPNFLCILITINSAPAPLTLKGGSTWFSTIIPRSHLEMWGILFSDFNINIFPDIMSVIVFIKHLFLQLGFRCCDYDLFRHLSLKLVKRRSRLRCLESGQAEAGGF